MADLNGPLHDHIATTYGITGKSVLNDLRYFHVVNGLVPDIMHDILEGTLQLTLKCLMHHLIKEKKYFSLSVLNGRIASFNYGSAELSNKPSEISRETFKSSKTTLKQSGMIRLPYSRVISRTSLIGAPSLLGAEQITVLTIRC